VENPALAQLASVGILWVAFHCAGMCGPIVGGVVGGGASSTPRAVLGLLRYQLGRAVGLGTLGAVVGGAGAVLGSAFERAGGVFALVMAGVLLLGLLRGSRPGPDVTLSALHRRRGWRHRVELVVNGVADRLARLAQRLRGRPFLLGIALSFLPCMIIVWALSLAATTGSALQGAQVMWLLVAMTTVPLLPAVVGVRLAMLTTKAPWLVRLPQLVSGVWLLLVGLAGVGVIAHQHVVVDVFGARTVMLW
jgi:sulfite exporter TauE/SafE